MESVVNFEPAVLAVLWRSEVIDLFGRNQKKARTRTLPWISHPDHALVRDQVPSTRPVSI